MSCERWEERIALDVGGDLPDTEAAALARHLRGCPECRRLAEDMAASQRDVRRHSAPPFDAEILARIRAGVHERLDSRRGAIVRRPRAAARWLPLAAGLALVVGLWQLSRPDESHDLPTESPPAESARSEARSPLPPFEIGGPGAPGSGGIPAAQPRATPPIPPPPRPTATAPTDSPSVVVVSNGEPVDPRSFVALSDEAEATSNTLLDLEDPPREPATLRLVFESPDAVVYWLDAPAPSLKEKEDVDTKVL